MPNTFFQFKQFTIHQDQCAMKVCTDACVFGAWMSSIIFKYKLQFTAALDIGCGTGLLSLMLAQKNNFSIDAIEIDHAAAIQAEENIRSSKWTDQIKVHHLPLQEFSPQKKYDFIFSNPPFFEKDLMSKIDNKNAAKHDTTLTFEDIVDFVNENLSENGFGAVLIPFHRVEYFESLLHKKSLHIQEKMLVKQSTKHHYFRTMYFFSKQLLATKLICQELIIHDDNRHYSKEMSALLSDYYLKL